ncbi:MAG: LLM class F420-dependent oxidoreductase [Alphaproteobacteria bacterium]
MKIGLFGINMARVDAPDTLLPLMKRVEEMGFESVWTGEHVMIPRDYASAYPFNTSGRIGVPPETHFIDPLIALSHVAAHTTTLRLGTGINLLPQSNPLLFAKQVASLDHLSKGRVLLGLGVGWLAEEFTAMGVPFAGRGRRFDDYLRAVKKVWSGVEVEHQSDYLNWSGFKSYPLPHAPSGPPIIIGGHSPAALRRTVATGDGWFAFPKSHDELSGLLGQLRDRAAAAGRDPATIEITALWRDFADGMASLETYREMGVHRLLAPLGLLARGDLGDNLERLQETAASQLL